MLAMDGKVLHTAEWLQSQLDALAVQKDRDTLVWAHGFLTGVIKNIERRIPDLMDSHTLLGKSSEAMEHLRRDFLKDIGLEPDSLEQIERKLRGEEPPDDAPVPARRKSGPKGKSGGEALPLPDDSGLPM